MITCRCIQKFRNKHGKIYGYKLQDSSGQIRDVTSEELKRAINDKQINITNLVLTTDGRIISKRKDTSNIETDIDSLIAKARISGKHTIKNGIHIINVSDSKVLAYIPNDIDNTILLSGTFENIKGHLKVIGGSALIDAEGLFEYCKAQSLDLTNFDTSNIEYMSRMFQNCSINHIDLSNFNTSRVNDMSYMFCMCNAQTLNISNFNTSNVVNMHQMFKGCKINKLNLSSFNTERVNNMHAMFYDCETEILDLHNFDTSNVLDMSEMFYNCRTNNIDISNFSISDKTNLYKMFSMCNAEKITLSSKLLRSI